MNGDFTDVKEIKKDENQDLHGKKARNMKKKFSERFRIQKELLSRDDILNILGTINSDSKENLINQSEKIFEKLDVNNLGFVKTDDLISNLVDGEENGNIDEDLIDFFTKLSAMLRTRSEEIVSKLKKLRTKDWINKGDGQLLEKLNKIIYEISTQQLNDIEIEDPDKVKNDGEVSFIMKYSQMEGDMQKSKDFYSYRKSTKRFVSSKDFNNCLLKKSHDGFDSFTNMLSPSVFARLGDQIDKISCCDFDIFEVNSLLGKKTTIFLAKEILNKFSFVENGEIPQNILDNFITEIVTHYDREKAMYHNDLHAGDVMQTVFTIMTKGKLADKMKLRELDVFSIITAALCHDFKHPGTNNLYNINAKTKYAMRYNDISVLENYHIAQTFKVLMKNKFNIFKNFTTQEYRILRRRMIDGVLATDMANHTKVVTAAKNKAELYDIIKGRNFEKIFIDVPEDQKNNKELVNLYDQQQCILNMIIHTADISNPGKPDKISAKWTERVYGEFFIQGDLEKTNGLPISNFCDRNTTNVNKAMMGFISFVVAPTIDCLINLIPEVSDYSEYCKSNLRKHQKGAKEDDRIALLNKAQKK